MSRRNWRSLSRKASCAARRSVMSRVIFAKPTSLPVSSRTASMTAEAQNRLPSLRSRQPSASCRPSRAALSQAPALVLGAAGAPRLVQQARRQPVRLVLGREEAGAAAPDRLVGAVALDRLRAGIPAHHDTFGVEHADAVVEHGIEQQIE